MMNCPSCKTEQADTSRFCSACGAALRPDIEATVAHEPASPAVGKSVRSSLSDSSHHGRFLPGTEVADRYRIVSLLGKGGMGEVYRADDLKLGHTVALKFLPRELANDLQRLEYFHNEVRLTRQVSHPNVCRVYDIGEVDGQHFLSMEYIDGEDLKILLRRIGRLPKDKGVQIAQQICAGLAAAHEKGVLHRDLKPANIMIDGKGQVRITDFGLARLAGDGEAGEIAGTPAYMAPEQLAQGQTSIQSDLYSLGLILFELFTGQSLHTADTVRELQEAHENSSLVRPSTIVDDIDPAVERAILRCLERDPHDRPRSTHALAAALPGGDPLAAALAAGETPTPEMVAAAGGAGGVSRRSATLMLIGSGLCLLLNAWLADQTYLLRRSGSSSELASPGALERDAKDILKDLEYDAPDADAVYGFMTDGYEATFWYRQREQPFLMDSYWGEGINLGKPELFDPQPSRARPTFARPPMEFSDEVALKLTPEGLLRCFRRRPASIVSDGFGPSDADLRWNDWFPEERTGYSLETEQSRSSTTRGEGPLAKKVSLERSRVPTPPDAFDVVRLWEHNDDKGNRTRIVAAAFQGQPVYFEIFSSDEPEEAGALSSPASNQGAMKSQRFSVWKLQELLILVATIALAWWNIRSGRGDRRGALRLTQVVCSIGMVIWFTQTRHLLFEGFEVEVVTLGMAQVLFDGARMWLMYVAFEPLVRRFWPELLISAMRLLRGQYRDPRVGRDLLVGVAAGLVVVVIHRINMFVNLEMMNSKFNHQTYFNTHSLLGPMELLGAVLDAVVWSITVGGSVVMFLVIVRLAVRSGLVATAICVVLSTYTLSVETASDPRIAWLTIGLWMIGSYWVIVRFGYLAFVTVLMMYFLACRLPVTLDASMWYSQYSLLVNACIAAIAAYGFYVSQGIRPRPAAVQRVE